MVPRKFCRLGVSAVLFLVLLAGCGPASQDGRNASNREVTTQITTLSGGAINIQSDGVVIDIECSAKPSYLYIQRNSVKVREISIRGGKLSYENGELAIGDTSYGELKQNDKVVISSGGVTINGKHRGDLPKAKADPGE